MEIFEEVNKTYQKPKKVVLLTEIAQPGVQGGSPCPSLSSSPSAQSPRNSFIATSPSSHSSIVWPFQLVTKLGEVYEFFVETPEDQKQWLKRLSLLIMFPNSPIPEEPAVNPIKESVKLKLRPKDYNAGELLISFEYHMHSTCFQGVDLTWASVTFPRDKLIIHRGFIIKLSYTSFT